MRLGDAQQREFVAIVASGIFDAAWYHAAYPDVRDAGVDPLRHFVLFGWHEGRDPGPLFSVNHYLAQAPDVAAAIVNPLVHYLECGWREGRWPRADFDPAAYVARYGLGGDVCPLVHEAAQRYGAQCTPAAGAAIDG